MFQKMRLEKMEVVSDIAKIWVICILGRIFVPNLWHHIIQGPWGEWSNFRSLIYLNMGLSNFWCIRRRAHRHEQTLVLLLVFLIIYWRCVPFTLVECTVVCEFGPDLLKSGLLCSSALFFDGEVDVNLTLLFRCQVIFTSYTNVLSCWNKHAGFRFRVVSYS